MQRVRIGLTGLAFVFLAVLLAAVFTGQTREEAPVTANGAAARAGSAPPATQAPPEEPLATLGLTPSNSSAAPAAAPAGGTRR